MASANDTITIRNELRPCLVDGKPCLFHKWVSEFIPRVHHILDDDGEDDCEMYMCETTMGLIEHENGTVSMESVQIIQFLDTEQKLNETLSED